MKPLLLALIAAAVLALTACAAPSGSTDRMSEDERAVRRWFDDWIAATTKGDLPLARSLIDDDAVFLVPGAGTMDKESFAVAMTADDPSIAFDLDCQIEEIEILGDHAWLRTRFALSMTVKSTGERSKMAGHSLSILERRGAGWVVVRDANTMMPVPAE